MRGKITCIVEEQVNVKSNGKSERHFIVGREKEHRLLDLICYFPLIGRGQHKKLKN
jgi:hypothetical protein